MSASVVDYKVVARPNCSLSPKGMLRVVAALAFLPLSVAVGFGMAGAWLVFPFAGLELLAVAYAFYFIYRHAGDYESITIDGERIAIEQHSYKNSYQVVFHRYWAQVVLREVPGGEQRLWLRSHGKEVEVGRYMNNEQRLALAQQLQKRTGAVYQR
jgi:uncharacterized membrane protein